MSALKDDVPEYLREGITPAEEKLLEAANRGVLLDLTSGDNEFDKPENAAKWPIDRVIRAKFLEWLIADKGAKLVHRKGVTVQGARIDGDIDLGFANVLFPIVFVKCALCSLSLYSADIVFLNLNNSVINDFNADGVKVKGSIFLEGIRAAGEVRLPGADIGGVLVCKQAQFNKVDGDAFIGDRLKVKGGIFLEGIKAAGEVRLPGADIGGQLSCKEAQFNKADGHAFSADEIKVKGGIFLEGIKAAGEVRLPGADIGGQLSCKEAQFNKADGHAFSAEKMRVGNSLFLRNIKSMKGNINLSYTHVDILADDNKSWPENVKLIINGFVYDSIAESSPLDAQKRIEWINRQPDEYFSFQPFEHLAKIYKQMGHEASAREVLIAKQEALRKHGDLKWYSKAKNRVLGITIAHGYEGWRAFLVLLALWFIGSFIFCQANAYKIMTPSKERVYMDYNKYDRTNKIPPSEYPVFNPFSYSLDALIPFLDMHQEDYWLPDVHATVGASIETSYAHGVRIYLWIHIILGWIFSALGAGALTGLIRKE